MSSQYLPRGPSLYLPPGGLAQRSRQNPRLCRGVSKSPRGTLKILRPPLKLPGRPKLAAGHRGRVDDPAAALGGEVADQAGRAVLLGQLAGAFGDRDDPEPPDRGA